MSTVQDLVDGARSLGLSDPEKVHWTDVDMLAYAKNLFSDLMIYRPDLYVSNWTFDPSSVTLTTTFPFDPAYMGKCCEYIVARANMSDQETVNQGTAQLAMTLFSNGMLP